MEVERQVVVDRTELRSVPAAEYESSGSTMVLLDAPHLRLDVVMALTAIIQYMLQYCLLLNLVTESLLCDSVARICCVMAMALLEMFDQCCGPIKFRSASNA